ncbi:MAG: histidine phosphatase family protein [Clostridia bacterium]|nr:histidine phosphatase family protein [Clostridia bacterium]
MTTLLLIRHGESEANRDKAFGGQSDARLLPMGEKQAEITAKYIAENYKISKVYASDLSRALKTGKIIAKASGAPLIPCKNLREIYAGDWQGITFSEIERRFPEDYEKWISDIGHAACTGGESVKELSARILGALCEIAKDNEGKTVAVATHAIPIRAMQCEMENLPLSEMKNIPWVSNASVTEAIYENGKWTLGKVGYDKHLAGFKTVIPKTI